MNVIDQRLLTGEVARPRRAGAPAQSPAAGRASGAARRRRLEAPPGKRAGHRVEVLLRVYAKCIDGGEEAANRRIDEALAA